MSLTQKRKALEHIYHYTNKKGFNGIKSQTVWCFKVKIPKAPYNPEGAYFTKYKINTAHFYQKTRIPKIKQECVFKFVDIEDLLPYPGNRGRLKKSFYSKTDYLVIEERQIFHGLTSKYLEEDI